ncbi:thioredoxin family protein [Tenuibacillus multivorans]|uniref:Thiol-disulfide isomerase or thioredoxin n=1 Tax=Tenuibacillus multivorans TaxID=237069 RepID=A0A1H0B6Q1_9BACI|nr:thioredoxin family protein [Tenuibacillus multivorans]GEL78622.1 thiol reductase thioredoxin [Tenuibacillus multivorans]SDN41304.1 Thiol-disulfide isomerase or thioredoxin [Tenuibacillus multivorans]
MKKLIIFGATIIVLFIAVAILTNLAQTETVGGDNPYGKESLNSSTAELLDNEHYQNIILPDELQEKLDAGEDVTVYFFSPECSHCRNLTPRLMPLADEMGVDVKQYNLLEFEDGWNDYHIEATPTLIHFEDGEEVDRIVGDRETMDEFETFFNQNALN